VTDNEKPPLVTAVEAALGAKVLALRYLPSPSVAAAALAAGASGGAQDASEVAFNDRLDVDVAQSDLRRVLRPTEVDLPSDDEPAG
jgi:hypothetical protein